MEGSHPPIWGDLMVRADFWAANERWPHAARTLDTTRRYQRIDDIRSKDNSASGRRSLARAGLDHTPIDDRRSEGNARQG